MEKITSSNNLKNAIQLLEAEHTIKVQVLKEQFYLTYKSFKPVNILLSTLKDAASSPYLLDNILGTVVGLATGYLSKKIVTGVSGNIFRKILGSVVQYRVANTVAQHPEGIKSIAQFIFQRIFRKKEMNVKEYNG